MVDHGCLQIIIYYGISLLNCTVALVMPEQYLNITRMKLTNPHAPMIKRARTAIAGTTTRAPWMETVK